MIPKSELQLLRRTIQAAWALGHAGNIQEGYQVVDAGILWAETPAFHLATREFEAPDPWADELAELYRAVLVRYAHEFGSGPAPVTLVLPAALP